MSLFFTGAKYDPSQPRIPAGNPEGGHWTSTGGNVRVYHGAESSVVDAVLKEGLKPGREWYGRTPSVYVAEDPVLALNYAMERALGRGTSLPRAVKGVVFEVEVPEAEFGRFLSDNQMPAMSSAAKNKAGWRLEGKIPPSWIKSVSVYELNVTRWLNAKPADKLRMAELVGYTEYKATSELRLFVPIVIQEETETLFTFPAFKYSPDQPRVPKGDPQGGQWTAINESAASWQPDPANVQEIREYHRRHLTEGIGPDDDPERTGKLRWPTAEEVEKRLVDKLQQAVDKGNVCVRRSTESLLATLRDERMKTIFETGVSEGYTNVEWRTTTEKNAFGVPENVPAMARPVYGYVDRIYDREAIDFYGPAEVVLKPSVRSRTRVTVGDSADAGYAGTIVGSPINNVGIECFNFGIVPDFYKGKRRRYCYIEAQVLGGIRLSDISRVRLHTKLFNPETRDREVAKLTAALDAKKISWELVK